MAQAPGYDSTDGCDGSWQPQFGVQVLILDCKPGYATEHDRAYMYARGRVDPGADWRGQLDFTNAVWVFDAGARRKASLIIDFHRNGTALAADFYDDLDGDGEVRYGFERGYPRSVETRFPVLRVTAPDGWWVRDGKVNYNLKLSVDGPRPASHAPESYIEATKVDGVPDVLIDVRDTSGQGRPRVEVIQVDPPGMENLSVYGIVRTAIMVNEADDELTPDTYILWPHLGYKGPVRPEPAPPLRRPLSSIGGAGYGMVKPYKTAHPPIQIDWERARIDFVGEFVASRGRPHNWFVYTLLPVGRDARTDADFENPFAFYDLAGANDGYPDLQVRDEFYTADDPYTPYRNRVNHHNIRYSWDQEHERTWRYKVGLYGARPMPSLVDLGGGLRLRTARYQEYPSWAMRNAWDSADFVATEQPRNWTTEGLYENCSPGERHPYYMGLSAEKPGPLLGTTPGMRCEYVSYLGEAPRLYLGAVDRKLHLYRAEEGVWTLHERTPENDAPTEAVRYSAVDGPFVDRWERLSDGVVQQSLFRFGDRLLYADVDGVHVARGPEQPALFLSAPPTDPAEWRSLREQLAAALPPGGGGDLWKLFDAFKEERVSFPNAAAWDARAEGAGFRFTLRLTEPLPENPVVRGLDPGTYVVTYRPEAGYAARPAGPARVSLSAPVVRGDAPTELGPTRLSIEVRNDGDQDLSGATVLFVAGRPEQAGQTIGWATVDAPAGQTVAADVLWIPGVAGDWDVRASTIHRDAASSPVARIAVARAPRTDVGSLLLAQGLQPFTGGAISASLTLAAGVAVGLGFVVWPRSGPRDRRTTDV
ncbi:MAG TPA: hypothetical protein VG370_09845 [Chloroflexota bacterium]|nr:hypothetical protein [Chloroflexota bacterium]